MKKPLIIANWKSNKTQLEAEEWLQEFQMSNVKCQISNKNIIICPPFTLLSELKSLITNYQLPITLGAQDISPYDAGAYTGEINGKQIKEFANYVLIGHSERRRFFSDTAEVVNKKIEMALKFGLVPVICVSDLNQIQNLQFVLQHQKAIIAYEPVFAIGSGNPDSPESADKIGEDIKNKLGGVPILYGGSINSKNVSNFTKMSNIDGVLVGNASLDPQDFLNTIKNA